MARARLKVIIADDNNDFIDSLYEYISKQNDMEIIGIATNGMEAYEQITERKPDMVFLDIIMPAIDGISILEKVNAEIDKVKPVFIVVSAVRQDKIAQKAISLGAEYFFVKPCDFDQLVSTSRHIYYYTMQTNEI